MNVHGLCPPPTFRRTTRLQTRQTGVKSQRRRPDVFNAPSIFCGSALGLILAFTLTGAAAAGASRSATLVLPGARTFPESLTSTPDGALYIGSLGAGGIYRVAPKATSAELWIKPGAFGGGSIFGVLADKASNTLWACSNNLAFAGVTIPGADSAGSLKAFDLTSGKGKASYKLPGPMAVCNDIAVAADGSVFVTETSASQVLKLAPGGDHLEVWLSDPVLQPPPRSGGLDGIAFGGDGALYVSNNGQGALYRITLAQGRVGGLTRLRTSRPLAAPDALRRIGPDRFLLIENGGRLDEITVHGQDVAVQTLKDGMLTPTSVTTTGAMAWVSEGQLDDLLDPRQHGRAPSLPFRLYRVPVPQPSTRP